MHVYRKRDRISFYFNSSNIEQRANANPATPRDWDEDISQGFNANGPKLRVP